MARPKRRRKRPAPPVVHSEHGPPTSTLTVDPRALLAYEAANGWPPPSGDDVADWVSNHCPEAVPSDAALASLASDVDAVLSAARPPRAA